MSLPVFKAKNEETKMNFYSLDPDFLRRIWSIHKCLFPSWKSITLFLFVCLLIIEVLEQLVGYKVGMVTGNFYKVLEEKDLDGFLDTALDR